MSWVAADGAQSVFPHFGGLNYPNGTAVPNQPDPPFEIPTMMGWECPRCRTIHGPFVHKCGCSPPVKTWPDTGTAGKDNW